ARRAIGCLCRVVPAARDRGTGAQRGGQETGAGRTLMLPDRFALAIRLLHWTMAALIIAMLFIGIAMVSTAGPAYSALLALHRPLGIAILLLACIRLAIRIGTRAPPLP